MQACYHHQSDKHSFNSYATAKLCDVVFRIPADESEDSEGCVPYHHCIACGRMCSNMVAGYIVLTTVKRAAPPNPCATMRRPRGCGEVSLPHPTPIRATT